LCPYFLISGLIIFMACSLDDPKLPNWFVEWRIPIPQADWVMEEATDDSNIVLDTTLTGMTFLEISVVDSLDRQSVDPEDMATLADPDSNGDHIDDIDLNNLGPIYTDTISTADLLGIPLIPGTTIDVPGGTINLTDLPTSFPTYIWAHAKSGEMTLELVNNTFLNLNSGCSIIIRDTNLTLLGTAVFPDPINAYDNGFSNPPIDLTDQTFVNKFLLTISLPVQPEQDHPVTSQDSASSLWVVVRIRDLVVYESRCMLPPQEVDITDSVSIMDERHRIYWAVVDHGLVNVDIENRLPVPADILISLPNIHDAFSGEEFSHSYHLDPLSTRREQLILDGLKMEDHPDPNSGDLIDYLLYDAYALTDSTGEMVNITGADSILVRVYPDSIYFSEVNGVLDRIDVDIEPVEKTDLFDASRIDGRIFLDSLNLRLNLYNETDIPIYLTMNISGHNETQSMTIAPINLIVPRASAGGFLQEALNISDPHPNIVDLMGILPSDVRIDATAYVEGAGQIRIDQQVWGDYEISSPLYLRLADTVYVHSDADSMRVDEDVRKNIEERLESAVASMDAFNGLPISARAAVYVSTDSADLFDETIADSSVKFIISDIGLQAGTIGADGYVQTPVKDKILVPMTEQQLNLFTLDTLLYIGSKISIDKTDGLVKFKPSDQIKINGSFRIKFLMGENEN
jgi:hypothetical protein